MALIDNLVAYYKLDSNSNDSFWTNNWVDTSMTYTSGKINNCGSFNWTTSKIVSSNNSWFTWDALFSMSAWVNVSTLWSSNTYSILNIGTVSGTPPNNMSVVVSWETFFGSIAFLWNGSTVWIANWLVSTSTWHHICVTKTTWNISTWVKIYLNWSLQTLTKSYIPQQFNISNDVITIGQYDGTSYKMNWLIDELWIWNKVLTASEVTELYNSWNGLSYPFSTAKSAFFAFL